MYFDLPNDVKKALLMLEQHGFEAYVVGGCVRDMILQLQPVDFDITTNATPLQTKEVFSQFKMLDIGMKHGTITVFICNRPIEITTYRVESEYNDNRHPSSVVFAPNLKDDLCRRDFTMNAIAYHDKKGIVDLYHGVDDIKAKTIRAIGDGEIRFQEDALRIMRAFRFGAQLGFAIEQETCKHIAKTAPCLRAISKERIRSELMKILLANDSQKALYLMEQLSVLEVILPCVARQKEKALVFSAIAKSEKHLLVRLALLYADISSSSEKERFLAKSELKNLRLDNKTLQSVMQLIENLNIEISSLNKADTKRLMNQLTADGFLLLLQTKKALLLAEQQNTNQIDKVQQLVDAILGNKECYRLNDLAINGEDLIALGITGKAIGFHLDKLLDIVIENPNLNHKPELLSYLKNQFF